jgi:N-acetylglucosaminyl-diphospho-decaprenol L-rhamnosyltransferase
LSKPLPIITISIVSHLQGDLVKVLMDDIKKYCKNYPLKVDLTLNLPEQLDFDLSNYPFPILTHSNQTPLGFSSNHNNAFKRCKDSFFCVMNPDVRMTEDPFNTLVNCLMSENVGVVSPLVVNDEGTVEDSARVFPTPLSVFYKLFGGGKRSDYLIKNNLIYPDWIAGMFMLFPSKIFKRVGGFDERFFLYYEDVDLCARLRLLGYEIIMCPNVRVIHYARRSSHHSLKYFRWHLISMSKFFCSTVFIRSIFKKYLHN